MRYKRLSKEIELVRGSILPVSLIETAVIATNDLFVELTRVAPYVNDLLGMRNLSAFVGAAFGAELSKISDGLLVLNPHQDGYPDLLLMDSVGLSSWSSLSKTLKEKSFFSPFPSGGIEIKATVGDVESAKVLTKKGLAKPEIGDSRIHLVKSINWKAHHRETNHLLALYWDFISGLPAIAAVMYSADLSDSDWGKMVLPVEGGGKTTSVSIMTKSGVAKLAKNCLLVLDDSRYEGLIARTASHPN